jgi:hypothetical protein
LKPIRGHRDPRRTDVRLAAITSRTSASTACLYAPSDVFGETPTFTSLAICRPVTRRIGPKATTTLRTKASHLATFPSSALRGW